MRTIISSISLVVMTLALGMTGCSSGPSPAPEPVVAPEVSRAHATYPLIAAFAQTTPYDAPRDRFFDFQNRSPLEFLEWVARDAAVADDAFDPFTGTLVFGEIHRGWIRDSDLPALVAMTSDRRPALKWMLETCSFTPDLPQTVGEHAAAMILAYRSEQSGSGYGGYPGSLNSDHVGKTQFAVDWATEQIEKGEGGR